MRGVFSTWCALCGAAVFAAEPASPSQSQPDAEASLAGVKRDFAAIKAAREAAGNSTLDLPRLTAPELQAEARRPAVLKTPAPEKKSTNWLVDAIESKSGANGVPGQNERDERSGFAREPRAEDEVGTLRKKAPTVDRKTGRTAETAVVVNPLTSFMAGWMTPQDLALLRPSMGGPTAAESIARGERPREFLEQSVSGIQQGKGADIFAGRERAPLSAMAPRTNPFLESIGLPAVAPAVRIGPPPAIAASTTNALAPPPVESVSAKSKIPEFAKPPEDEKYFRQLKRF